MMSGLRGLNIALWNLHSINTIIGAVNSWQALVEIIKRCNQLSVRVIDIVCTEKSCLTSFRSWPR